jgi:hypothetical protein
LLAVSPARVRSLQTVREGRQLDLDTHIDPAKLLEFHDVMLGHVQDDERARRAWGESDSADRRRRREELRREWRAFYLHMSGLHARLSEENATKAAALLEEREASRA